MEGATTYLFTQGVLGIGVVVLSIVVNRLYNQVQKLQDARLEDSRQASRDYLDILQKNTQSNLLLAEKIESAKKGK